jgi:hypothetical protein
VTVLLDRQEIPPGWLCDPWADLPPEFAAYAPLVPAGVPVDSPLFGPQRPNLFTCPAWASSAGPECIDLAAEVGLFLDPWEAWFLIHALGETEAGKWASFAVKILVSRQNGKGAILEARELGGLFAFGEELMIHSAHRFNTCDLAYKRLLSRVESCDWMRRRIARTPASHGEEGIELFATPTIITGPGGRQVTLSRTPTLRFLARSGQAARGFTGDYVAYDEDMYLDSADVAASLPTTSARVNETEAGPQVWYAGSGGLGRPSTQLARVRRRGIQGGTSLCFGEWSVVLHDEYCVTGCQDPAHSSPEDPETIAAANPGLGIRLTLEQSYKERDELGDKWPQERLGVGTYPAQEDGWSVISKRRYEEQIDPEARRPGSVVFGLDVSPQRETCSIGLCGMRPDDRRGVEVADRRRGTGWAVQAATRLDREHGPTKWVVDPRTDAGSLITDLEDAGLDVEQIRARDAAQAFGMIYDGWRDNDLAYLDDPDLRRAVAGADMRKLAEGFAWDRVNATVDLSPLVAVTLAYWGHKKFGGGSDYDARDSVGYGPAEVARLYHLGIYGPADLLRLASAGIIRAADLGPISAAGVPIPAGIVVSD